MGISVHTGFAFRFPRAPECLIAEPVASASRVFIRIGHQSWMMIHRAAFGAIGKTFEVEDEVKFVKRIEGRILDLFTSRSKLTKQKIKRNWDRKDWWIDADECLELELVDEVRAMMPEHHANKKE